MKRKRHVSEQMGNVAVYWEDLQQVGKIVAGVCDEVVFTVEDVEYDSLDEVKQHCGTELSDLDIEGRKSSPYASLTVAIHRYGTTARSYGDVDAFVRAVNDIRLLLSKRKRVAPAIFEGTVAAVVAYLMLLQFSPWWYCRTYGCRCRLGCGLFLRRCLLCFTCCSLAPL